MEALGNRLRKARENKGLAIRDVHDATKIRLVYLIAMEEGKFHELPGDVYVRGFLRSVATVLGIAGDELVSEYDLTRKSSGVKKTEVHHKDKAKIRGKRKTVKAYPITAIILIIAAVIILVAVSRGLRGRPEDDTTSVITVEDGSHDISKPEPENDKQQDDEDGILSQSIDDLQLIHVLSITVTERCWVRVIADGHRLFEETMLPGETRTWTANEDIRIKLGNAGGVDITYNGIAVGPPGKSGDVVELSFPISGQ